MQCSPWSHPFQKNTVDGRHKKKSRHCITPQKFKWLFNSTSNGLLLYIVPYSVSLPTKNKNKQAPLFLMPLSKLTLTKLNFCKYRSFDYYCPKKSEVKWTYCNSKKENVIFHNSIPFEYCTHLKFMFVREVTVNFHSYEWAHCLEQIAGENVDYLFTINYSTWQNIHFSGHRTSSG